jgi:uncharacterized delta-60 repeat protein
MTRKIFASIQAVVVLAMLAVTATAQVSEEWAQRFEGLGLTLEIATAMTIDDSGNVYVTGYSYADYYDGEIVTIKYGPDGGKIWKRHFNLPGQSELPTTIVVDGEANVIVTGRGGGDFLTFKYSPDGAELWSRLYDGPGNGSDTAVALGVTPTGEIIVTGSSNGDGTVVNMDYATVKYSPDGNEIWVRRFDGPGQLADHPVGLAIDADGNAIVTGYSLGVSEHDYVTIKYSADGTELWQRRYDGPVNGRDAAQAVVTDDAGNIFVTGASQTHETFPWAYTSHMDYATIKYAPDGTQLWLNYYTGTHHGYDQAYAMAVDASGNVLVTGSSHKEGGYYRVTSDIASVKYSSDGTELWTQRHETGGSNEDKPKSIIVDAAGNSVVVGMAPTAKAIKYSPGGDELWIKSFVSIPDAKFTVAPSVAADLDGNIVFAGTFNDDYTTAKYSDLGNRLWVQYYDGPGILENVATAMVVDNLGNTYVTGYSFREGSCYYCVDYPQFATVKYAPDGGELWVRYYGGSVPSNSNRPTAIAVDESGNIIITGYSYVSSNVGGYYIRSRDYITFKYSPNGDREWVKTFNGAVGSSSSDQATDIDTDIAGNIFVTGYSYRGFDESDIYTIKYAPDGTELWVQGYRVAGSYGDYATALSVDHDGNAVVTGYSYRSKSCYWCYENPQYVTLKYETGGTLLWDRFYSYGADSLDRAYDLEIDGSNNVIVTGIGMGETGTIDYATVKYAPDGQELWAQQYDGPAGLNDIASAIGIDAADNIYVTGYVDSGANANFGTVKYAPEGTEIWARIYNGPENGNDYAQGIAVDIDGNVAVTGYNYNAVNADYGTVKYDSDGTELWTHLYNGPSDGNDVPYAVALDVTGNVVVTGYSYDSLGDRDYFTIKLNDQPKYHFSGFLEPLLDGGVYKAGRTLPVKFSLLDAEDVPVTTAVAMIEVYQVVNGVVSDEPVDISSNRQANSGTYFRLSGEQYIYNLSTNMLEAGSYFIVAMLDDGSEHYIEITLK